MEQEAEGPLSDAESDAVDDAVQDIFEDAEDSTPAGPRARDYYLLVEAAHADVWERHVGLTRREARDLRPWLRELVEAGTIETFVLERANPELYEVGLDAVKHAVVADLNLDGPMTVSEEAVAGEDS